MTFSAFHAVAAGRVRESVGLWFEELAAGQVFHHRPGLTVSQQANADEALATLNQAMIHFDERYAAATEFGRPLVVSTLTVQMAVGLGWKTFGRRRRITGCRSIRLTVPVLGGDTLYARTRILDTGACDDDPACGRVGTEVVLTREDGREVATLVYDQLIYRRGRGPFEGPTDPGTGFASHVDQGRDNFLEILGIAFEELEPGLVIEHRPGFVFSWAEARARARLAGDHAPAALDAGFSQAAGAGGAPAAEMWLMGLLAAATTRAFGRVVANLAWENVTFGPVPADGAVIRAESTVLDRRVSGSRPGQGLLRVATRGLDPEGVEVCRFERTLMAYRTGHGPHEAAGYG